MNPKRFLCTIISLVVCFAFISTSSASADTIFTDSFEGNYDNWSSHGLWSIVGTAHTGTSSAKIVGSTTGDTILEKNLSTLGYENITLSFWYKVQSSLESTDYVRAEFSIDSNPWSILTEYTSATPSGWLEIPLALPPTASNAASFKLRFLANLNSGSDDFRMDDVTLTGELIPTPSPTPAPIPTPTSVPTLIPTSIPTPTLAQDKGNSSNKKQCKNKNKHFNFWTSNCSGNWSFIKHLLRYN